jgi:hypothetical protein
VALAKRYAGSVGPRFERFVHSDAGGVLSVFGVSFFGAVAAATDRPRLELVGAGGGASASRSPRSAATP